VTDVTVNTTNRRRAASALAVALASALVLSGCAAGQDAQTANQFSVVDGSAADVGSISIRNAGLEAPSDVSGYKTGDDVEVVAAIVNNSVSGDTLTSVTTSAASSVLIGPTSSPSESSSSTPSATSTTSATTSASATPSGSATSTESAGASPTASATTSYAPVSTPIPIPANTLVMIGGTSSTTIQLVGLKSALISGQSIPVTFTFQSAGSVTVQLPVKIMKGSTEGETIDVEPSSEGE
jgi:copper(I)-binding protein